MRVLNRSGRCVPLMAISLAVGACGEGGSVAPTSAPAIDSVTLAQFAGTSMGLGQDLLHTVYGGQQFATPNPFILPALAAAPSGAAACAPVQTGVDTLGQAIDGDGDGTPDDYTLDYGTGCSQTDGGLELTFGGKYRLQEAAGSVAGFAFTTSGLLAMKRDTLTGNFFRQEVTGTESAHFDALHATHQMDVTLGVTSALGGDSSDVVLRTVATSSYDPDGGATFQLHGTLPQGTLQLEGQLIFTDLRAGADSLRFVLSTPTPIHTSFACASGIDGGVLQGLLEGDARVGFRSTWSGCGALTVSYFGAT